MTHLTIPTADPKCVYLGGYSYRLGQMATDNGSVCSSGPRRQYVIFIVGVIVKRVDLDTEFCRFAGLQVCAG